MRSSLDGFFEQIEAILRKRLLEEKDLTLKEECRLFRFLMLCLNCEDEDTRLCEPEHCQFAIELDWVTEIEWSKAWKLCDLIDDYMKKELQLKPNSNNGSKPLDFCFDEINEILRTMIFDQKKLHIQQEHRLLEFMVLFCQCWESHKSADCYPDQCGFASQVDWAAYGWGHDSLCDLLGDCIKTDFEPEPRGGGDLLGRIRKFLQYDGDAGRSKKR